MNLYSVGAVRDLENYLIDELGISSLVLMEHAAYSVFNEINKRFELKSEKFIVIVGTGNNGGDAYTLARMLLSVGASVFIYEVFGEPKSPDAVVEKNFLISLDTAVKFVDRNFLKNIRDFIVIDAVFGIGYKGDLDSDIGAIFRILDMAKFTISIDVPSGVDADSGYASKDSVKADLTVSFFLPKQGLYSYPASKFVGELVIAPLPFPIHNKLREPTAVAIDRKLVRNILSKLTPRAYGVHKGVFGHLAILSSTKGYEGAMVLASNGALVSGAGLITILTQDRTIGDFRMSTPNIEPDIMVEELSVEANYAKFDVIVAGPGFSKQRAFILKRLIDNIEKTSTKLVLDADALNILASEPEYLAKVRNLDVVLTPHPKEFSRLSDVSLDKVQDRRLEYLRDFVDGSRMLTVLKGAGTIIYKQSSLPYINPIDSPALATGGTGDFLAGLIGGFIAQGLNNLEASILAVYLHSRAGVLYANDNVDFTFSGGRLVEYTKKAMEEVLL